jgi:hypothetical protein
MLSVIRAVEELLQASSAELEQGMVRLNEASQHAATLPDLFSALQNVPDEDASRRSAARALTLTHELADLPPADTEQVLALSTAGTSQAEILAGKVIALTRDPSYATHGPALAAVELLLLVKDLGVLPRDLAMRAASIVGEPAFAPDDVLAVFAYLAGQSYAIYGVESFTATDKGPMVGPFGSTSNTCNDLREDWSGYVACSYQSACEFVRRFTGPDTDGILFIYTWGWKSEH